MIIPLLATTEQNECCLSQAPYFSTSASAHVGRQHAERGNGCPKAMAALIFPAAGFLVFTNRERLFPHASSLLAAFRKEEMLCECKILCDSGNRNQKFA